MDHILYEDFFLCLSSQVQSIEIQELNNLVDVKQMIQNIITFIIKRPIYEKMQENTEDKVLAGQMLLCGNLLRLI